MTINDNGRTTYLNFVGSYPPSVRSRGTNFILNYILHRHASDRATIEIVFPFSFLTDNSDKEKICQRTIRIIGQGGRFALTTQGGDQSDGKKLANAPWGYAYAFSQFMDASLIYLNAMSNS